MSRTHDSVFGFVTWSEGGQGLVTSTNRHNLLPRKHGRRVVFVNKELPMRRKHANVMKALVAGKGAS
jgi:hypothetical protein